MAASTKPPKEIEHAPSPWTKMPATTFAFPFWSKPPLLDYAYAPLEGDSAFADPAQSGAFKGGLGVLMLVRYRDTPAGPYDELIVIPGYFETPGTQKKNGKPLELPRITRIYVSQEKTCWNGRHNWNIPKHLANFNFTRDELDGSLNISVSPPSRDMEPFFVAKVKQVPYIPSFPFSSSLSKIIGLDMRMAHPSLASGAEFPNLLKEGEEQAPLCGTSEWRVCLPEIWGPSKLCNISMQRPKGDKGSSGSKGSVDSEGWWPRYQPWSLGLWIENGHVTFGDGHVPGVGK